MTRTCFPHPVRGRLVQHGAQEDPSGLDTLVQAPEDRLGRKPLSPGAERQTLRNRPNKKMVPEIACGLLEL